MVRASQVCWKHNCRVTINHAHCDCRPQVCWKLNMSRNDVERMDELPTTLEDLDFSHNRCGVRAVELSRSCQHKAICAGFGMGQLGLNAWSGEPAQPAARQPLAQSDQQDFEVIASSVVSRCIFPPRSSGAWLVSTLWFCTQSLERDPSAAAQPRLQRAEGRQSPR